MTGSPFVAYHAGSVAGFPPAYGPTRNRSRIPVLSADARILTDWQGSQVGRVTFATVYRGGFGSRMVALRVRLYDGRMMAGRYGYDGGSAVVLREVRP